MKKQKQLIVGMSNEDTFMALIVMEAIVILLLLIDSGKYGW